MSCLLDVTLEMANTLLFLDFALDYALTSNAKSFFILWNSIEKAYQ